MKENAIDFIMCVCAHMRFIYRYIINKTRINYKYNF